SAAEAMRCVPLTVSRDSLPPLAEGEYYHADLIGLSVRTPDGARVGTCVSVENFGAGDILEIEKADGKSFMMPLRPDAIPAWDAAVITINPDYIV
ncbi:MAG: 16S rRNA processing protein RimM, partial [Alphaproteobacteria bacterium]|nr:16S rRNA processing protein RimM [Alphaproteobacteria bacterium]